MLVALPDILIGAVEFRDGQWLLQDDVTPEQRTAFKKFVAATGKETVVYE